MATEIMERSVHYQAKDPGFQWIKDADVAVDYESCDMKERWRIASATSITTA